jgi:hypothetical protein
MDRSKPGAGTHDEAMADGAPGPHDRPLREKAIVLRQVAARGRTNGKLPGV